MSVSSELPGHRGLVRLDHWVGRVWSWLMTLTLVLGSIWLVLHLADAAPVWAFEGFPFALMPTAMVVALAKMASAALVLMSEGLEPR